MSKWQWELNPALDGTLIAVDRMGCGILVEDRDGQPVSKRVPEDLHGYLKHEQEKARAGDARSRLSALRRKDRRAIHRSRSPSR